MASNDRYTPKERAMIALERRPPVAGLVPTFELEFQLTQELCGKEFYRGQEVWQPATSSERERMIRHNAELYIEVAQRLDYAIIMIVGPHEAKDIATTANYIREWVGDRYLLICHGDATFAIPSGSDMVEMAVLKKLAGDKVCLLGGVQCSLLQTGTEDQIIEQCKYVLRHGLPGGGYIYGTTNVAFKGLPLERYLLILEMRKRYGWYDEQGQPCPELYKI